jgi:hypothetical protein
MTKTELIAIINQHSQTIDGLKYRFEVTAVVREPLWSGGLRYLFTVAAVVDGVPDTPVIYLLTQARITKSDLLRLLENAMQDELLCTGLELAAPRACSVTPP